MFCPEGYVSLTELWNAFFKKYRDELTQIALKKNDGKNFALGTRHGSADDFCEDAFLATFDEMTVFVASPDGQVMRLEATLNGGQSKLFSKLSPFESFIASSDPGESGEDNYWLRKLGSELFEPCNPYEQTITDCGTSYKSSEVISTPKVCYRTLPFVFERARYVISDEPAPWLSDALDEFFLPDIVKNFAGRSLCLNDKEARNWHANVMRGQRFLAAINDEPVQAPKLGRPEKKTKVKVAYAALYPEGHDVPLKAVRTRIDEFLDLDFSERTLRRAISEINSQKDKKLRK